MLHTQAVEQHSSTQQSPSVAMLHRGVRVCVCLSVCKQWLSASCACIHPFASLDESPTLLSASQKTPIQHHLTLLLLILPYLLMRRDGSAYNVRVNGRQALNLACSDLLGLGDDPVVQVGWVHTSPMGGT